MRNRTRVLGGFRPDDPHVGTRDDLEIEVGGKIYRGWKRVQVDRILDAASGSFRVTASEVDPWPIRPGASVKVWVGLDLLISGHVDEVRAGLGTDSHTFEVAGRDATADLVDCSIQTDTVELFEAHIGEIAEHVCDPFKIPVIDTARFGDRDPRNRPGQRFEKFAFNPGETAWSALERAGRMRGKLLYSRGDGALTMSDPGESRADVELRTGPNAVEGLHGSPVPASDGNGANVKGASLQFKHRDRFQTYVVKGQRPGSDGGYGATVAQISGSAFDDDVARFRPLTVLADGITTDEDAERRAQWEATFRAARSTELALTVQGWRQTPGGRLWTVNELARVVIPKWRLDSDFLISRVTYRRDDSGGTTSRLRMTRPDAFKPAPRIDPVEEFEEFFGDDDGEGF